MFCIKCFRSWAYETSKVVFSVGCVAAFNFCYADQFSNELDSLGISQHSCKTIPVTPIRLMDTETLFRSADAERDTRMSLAQKLLNNRWLAGNSNNTYSGGSALGKYLRMSFREYLRSQKPTYVGRPLEQKKANIYAEFTDIDNYELRITEEKVKFEFEYNF